MTNILSVLPDVLQPELRVVFCGTAASNVSARLGAYYANRGNRFWPTLHRIDLTPHRLNPQDFRTVTRYGLGLTDLAKHESGVDSALSAAAFDVAAFIAKIRRCQPAAVAFTSKKAGWAWAGGPVDYGRQPETIGESVVFVLPSPSGAARRYWDEAEWHALAAYVRALPS